MLLILPYEQLIDSADIATAAGMPDVEITLLKFAVNLNHCNT